MKSILWLLLGLGALFSVNAYKGEPSYRLNTNIHPFSYTVVLKPYLLPSDGPHRFTFDGEVLITIKVKDSNVSEITLNSHLLTITNVWLTDNKVNVGKMIQSFANDNLNFDETAQKLTLKLKEQLRKDGVYLLHFKYGGQIRDDQKGFFRVNYTDSAGNEKWIGLTQSQSINARSIFPCFDEPIFRSFFSLEISRPANYNTVFNTELLKTLPDGEDRFWDRFASTPAMPTYLFAFILSEFVTHGSDSYKIVTHVEHENKTDFAYKVGERATKAYGDYFQKPYRLESIPPMQMASSPTFPFHGMENWGLIIYRDEVLVHEPGYTDDWSNKQFTLTTIMHEIAHMWFGNSVTFSWWNHFWLSEAFARYFQYIMAHKLYREYELVQQFVVNEVHLALSIDASSSTQPLTSPEEEIQAPSEIDYKFSSITYSKGACIIRMMANLMTQPNFDRAIRGYLDEFLYKNTTPADLFKHIQRNWPTATPIDLNQFFYDWTEQVGYPVLFVNASAKNLVTLSQKRFLYDSGDGSNSSLTYVIPITYATDLEPDFYNNYPRFYFSDVSNVSINFDKPFKWIVFNLLQSNYYRVFYDRTTLFNIKAALSEPHHSEIPPSNRAQLVDDLFNFARVAMLDYETVFQFLEYLAHETDYLPWHAVFTNLPRVTNRLNTQQQKDFAGFLNVTLVKVYTHLGFILTNVTVLDTYNRIKVISWACKYHLFDCDKQAQQLFNNFKRAGVKPPPDFREAFYCSATREGTFSYYQTLRNWFEDEKLVSEKKKLIRAMGCTGHLYEYHYDKIISGNIPKEYAIDAFTSMYEANPENVEAIFVMLTDSIKKFAESVGGWSIAANVISDIANYFTTHKQKKLLEDFVRVNGSLFDSSMPELHHAIYVVETNLKWAEMRLPRLLKYLKKSKAASISSLTAALLIFINLSHVLF